LVEQVLGYRVVVGHVSSWWCSSVCGVGQGVCVNSLVDQGLLGSPAARRIGSAGLTLLPCPQTLG
jgi:hypothetical protein